MNTTWRGRFLAVLILGALLSRGLQLAAEPVSADNVVAAVRGWLALTDRAPLDEPLGDGLTFLAPETDDAGNVLFYAAYLENGGVVVMAPDDAIEPVIAFAPRAGDFNDPSPCNHLRMMLMADLADRLAAAQAAGVKGDNPKTAKWAVLIAAAKDPQGVKGGLGSISDVRVGPLTYSRWNQSYVYQGSTKLSCYNYYTPPYTAGSYQNYYCGCTATALAQLMWYHKYPTKGIGQVSCSIHVNGAAHTDKTRGGNGSGGAYDWANMPSDPAGLARVGRLNSTQRSAVGALCHDAAIASQMSFYSTGSSAPLCWSKGNHPLQTVFRYANVDSPWVAASATFSKGDINSAINPSLDAGMPGCLAINNNSGGGHAVVVDGYGYAFGNVYHHLNMGWGGLDTAWYNLPTVKDVQNSPYFRVTGLVFNVNPTLSGISVISGRTLNLAGNPLPGVKVVARHTGGIYPNKSAISNAKGIYALKVQTGQYTVSASIAGYGFKPDSATVSVGSTVVRNSWFNNFKAVTRIMRLSTESLAFGKVPVGTIASLPLKVFNDGTASLTVTGIGCPDGFWTDPATFTVPPNGGMTRVTVYFNPFEALLYEGTLTLRSNRSAGSNTAALSGRGQGSSSAPAGMVLIPAGAFTMGDSFTEGSSDEWPAHTATISAFYMGRTEVTKQAWDEVRSWGATNGYTDLPSGFGKATNHPVTQVTWVDCLKWCNARSQRDGRTPVYYTDAAHTLVMKTGADKPEALWSASGYRLPTEAEWEKAARGGLSGKRFPWGDTISHSQANYISYSYYSYDVSPTRDYHPDYDTTIPYTAPVAAFSPNGYGLYNMAGNVREWCWDWEGGIYDSLPVTDPLGPPESTSYHRIRGGSWEDAATTCRVSERMNYYYLSTDNILGFRLALHADP